MQSPTDNVPLPNFETICRIDNAKGFVSSSLNNIKIIIICYIVGSYKPIICPSGDLNAATFP